MGTSRIELTQEGVGGGQQNLSSAAALSAPSRLLIMPSSSLSSSTPTVLTSKVATFEASSLADAWTWGANQHYNEIFTLTQPRHHSSIGYVLFW